MSFKIAKAPDDTGKKRTLLTIDEAATPYQHFVFYWRYSAWLSSLIILVVSVATYNLTGLLNADAVALGFSSREHLTGMMLLMTLMPMWLLVCFVVTQRHSLSMAQRLDEHLAMRVMVLPKRQLLIGIVAGLVYGLAFNVPTEQWGEVVNGNAPMTAVFSGQLLIWACVGLLLSVRLYVVNQFYELGKNIEISIFEQSSLEPFARVGMLDVVIVVGGMVVATVQSIDAHFRVENYLTAFLVAIPAAIALLIRPMWTLHQRLATRKTQLLDEVLQQIKTAPGGSSNADMAALETLLKRRDRVKALHTWPLDLAIWSRLIFYVLIPPLAWSGAALVEVIIDRMLGI